MAPALPVRYVATTVDGWRIAGDVTGEGPPLLLVPGNMMAGTDWHATGYVERLAPTHRVVTVDPLGHGSSDRPHDPAAYGVASLVEHLVAVLDHVGIGRALVWGYSRGAFQASALAARRPERVAAVACGGFRYPSEGRYDHAGVAALRQGDWATFWTTFPVPVAERARRRLEATNDPAAVGAAMDAIADAVTELPAAGVPFMAYVGDGEGFAGTTRAALAAEGVECLVLPTGGHGPTFAAAAVAVAAVEPFLRTSAHRAG